MADALSRKAISHTGGDVTQQSALLAEMNSLQIEIIKPESAHLLNHLSVQSTILYKIKVAQKFDEHYSKFMDRSK